MPSRQRKMRSGGKIESLRIEQAKESLLSVPSEKVIVIAEEHGFASEQSFYRNFKKFTGMTPAQWRRENA